ncbi:MAG: DUF1543 domain-containing protein [Actinomycetes bacterium]
MSTLYAVFLGGTPAKGRMGEDHEVVFVVAENVAEMKTLAKRKWTGLGRPHVDAYEALRSVDGFDIALVPGANTNERSITDDNETPHN